MKSNDFAQFMFYSSAFDEKKIVELFSASKNAQPTLATKAIFLRLISLSEIKDLQKKSPAELDAEVEKILSPIQIKRTENLNSNISLKLAQSLIDTFTVDFFGLEELLALSV